MYGRIVSCTRLPLFAPRYASSQPFVTHARGYPLFAPRVTYQPSVTWTQAPQLRCISTNCRYSKSRTFLPLSNSKSRTCVPLRTLSDEVAPIKKKKSLIGKMLKEYGPVFFVFHACTSFLTIGIFYILVSRLFTFQLILFLFKCYIYFSTCFTVY